MRLAKIGIPLLAVAAWVATEAMAQRPSNDQDPRRPGAGAGGAGRDGNDDGGPGEPPPPPPLPPPPPPPFGPPPNPLFLAIDANKDGELSALEIRKAPEAMLKLDRNRDGILTEDEVRPPPPPGGPDGPPPPPGGGGRGGPATDPTAFVDSVMKFDKDGDGKITAQELPARLSRLLQEGDANKDKALERSEIETLARKPAPRRAGPPGNSPPPQPPPPPSGDPEAR